MAALGLIRKRIDWCESRGVEILCCPEAVLGGLADYAPRPTDFAISVADGQLDAVLAPLASNIVTVIVGFTDSEMQVGSTTRQRSFVEEPSLVCIASCIRRFARPFMKRATRYLCSASAS